MGKLELVQLFCCHFHAENQMFAMVDYVRKVTAKKSLSLANMDWLNFCSSCSFCFVFVNDCFNKVRSITRCLAFSFILLWF